VALGPNAHPNIVPLPDLPDERRLDHRRGWANDGQFPQVFVEVRAAARELRRRCALLPRTRSRVRNRDTLVPILAADGAQSAASTNGLRPRSGGRAVAGRSTISAKCSRTRRWFRAPGCRSSCRIRGRAQMSSLVRKPDQDEARPPPEARLHPAECSANTRTAYCAICWVTTMRGFAQFAGESKAI